MSIAAPLYNSGMSKFLKAGLLTLILVPAMVMAQAEVAAPPKQVKPAKEVLEAAQKQAAAEKKNVFVIFHASWCGWCKKMDAFMAMPQWKQIFDDNFVTVHLTVLESAAHKADENPGGEAVMEALGGKGAGLPFSAILDPKGKMLVNSNRPTPENPKGSNIGHPFAPEEVDHFMTMLKKAAPRMTAEQAVAMKTWLSTQKK